MDLQRMSQNEYALSARAEGGRVTQEGGVWWREVRPFFFRPLLPYVEYPAGLPPPSVRATLGGYQYVVRAGSAANTAMQFLMFPDASAYSLDKLNADRRRQVRMAAKRFTVRAFASQAEFQDTAHAVYVSFYHRTRYSHFSNRLKYDRFCDWARALFATPGTKIIGAFAGTELAAVNVSRVVDDTLMFSTFFARREAMQHHVSSLVLHEVRMAAARHGQISQVYAGMRKAGAAQSVDDFYLHRGCEVKSMAAILKLNPVSRLALRVFSPGALRHLVGAHA